MEYVLIPATVNAHAERNARICDIPGDFLSADMDEDVKMALRGRLAELMVNIAPKIYIHHVIYEKARMFLYVTRKEVLYGCLILILLFYDRTVADMRSKGFDLNPYNPCVTNKMIGCNHMAV